jgi:hypothetical protein
MSYASKNRKRFTRLNALGPNAKWRSDPASENQWKVLRRIGKKTKERFPETLTKGEATEIISRHYETDPAAFRRHRRAKAKRKREQAANKAAS